jgi:RNA polymerase sigma factor (sigma-70 family)
MPTPDDATLEADVLAAARGERDAFARLIAATSALVMGVALAETRDADVARDAAQDVYLQVWQGLGQLRQSQSFLPWLRESARRQARRLAARRKRQAPGEAGLAEVESPSVGPAQRLLDEERAALVREAIEALPDDSRETLLLYYLEGHSAAQVGRLLGLSDAAVHQRLSRARGMVREEVLQRLGEAVGRAAPGGAFTAAVVALLAPRTAVALGIGELMAMASGSKVTAGVIAAAFLALAFLLYPRGGAPGPGAPPVVTVARPAEERAPGVAPRPTPALEAAPAEAGWLEVRVTGDGAVLAGAEVRAYLRLPIDPSEGRAAWRLAGQAVAGGDGVAHLPAAAGSWLVAASARGYARVQVAVIRPASEAATVVEAPLARPLLLHGRTVDRAGQPVPLAALRLSREPEGARVDAPLPEEEQAGAVADAAGSFSVGGLSPGTWRLTAEAAGHARTVVSELRLPRTGPFTVTLDASGVIEGLVRLADGSPAAGAEVSFAGGPELLRARPRSSPGATGSRRGSVIRWAGSTTRCRWRRVRWRAASPSRSARRRGSPGGSRRAMGGRWLARCCRSGRLMPRAS